MIEIRIYQIQRSYIAGDCNLIIHTVLSVFPFRPITNILRKEDEMGRACSTHGGEEECMYDIGGEGRRKETTRKTKT
jgi:hypothetical protein